ncbi:MAG: GFA family protein [Pseudorhodobacter sp.]|nr:GFA family protein [Pseudorhodobacter sp.]
MSVRTGGCMCGAVRFEAQLTRHEFGACHCEMCRRWTGSALLGITVPRAKVVWSGQENIATIQSSSWAERAWCSKCGSGLYFRVTVESDYSNDIEIPVGLLDDANGLSMANEIYIDHKPDSYAFAGEGRTLLTRQDCIEKFSLLNGE